jgi:hypothetical protein
MVSVFGGQPLLFGLSVDRFFILNVLLYRVPVERLDCLVIKVTKDCL